MSKERFEWLRAIGTDEIIATPGTESNVKEIYDKCWELRKERGGAVMIFNQFEEFGNAIWHYAVTGGIVEEVFQQLARPGSRLAAYVSATGSAGTIAAGDYLRTRFPHLKVVATEAQQCPTLLANGFGSHRIEGIGDKHVPWVHNVRNTDVVAAIDDEQCMSLLRLFNEDEGMKFLAAAGVPAALVEQLPLVGISGICNLVAAIKTAKYYELDGRDVLLTPLTDSMALYESRIRELRDERGPYTRERAARDFSRYLEGCATDHLQELGYPDRKRLHNLKYFTWVEQQGKTSEELAELWEPDFWTATFAQAGRWDELIRDFNRRTGVLDTLD
jgi:cysteine synthase